MARHFVTALNIGSMGFFWWELPRQTGRFYDSIHDLESPGTKVRIEQKIEVEWGRRTLTPDDLVRAANCMFVMSKMAPDVAQQIFGPYVIGLTFLSKTDIHFQFERDVAAAFVQSLLNAMRHFGAWDGQPDNRDQAVRNFFTPIFSSADDLEELFNLIKSFASDDPRSRPPIKIGDAAKCKALCDTFLIKMCASQVDQAVRAELRKSEGEAS
ncbi:MAG TPA: hypothetical protein VGB82_12130 [Alphaproteobacteria bacterium]